TNTFVVYVIEANSAPTLPGQIDFTIPELTTLVVTNTAADPDVPANRLSYALQSGPGNAMISVDGVITWRPADSQVPSTSVFTTVVTDNGVPPLSATNSFTVFVLLRQPVVVRFQAGAGNNLVLSWSSPSSNWLLQETATLEAPDWTNSTNSVQILGGQRYQVL